MQPDKVLANKPYYLSAWRAALRTFLGWSSHQIEDWTRRLEPELETGDGFMYHESAAFDVAVELVNLLGIVGRARSRCIRDLEQAIMNGNRKFEQDPQFDWFAARARVNDVLARYGKQLPESAEQRGRSSF